MGQIKNKINESFRQAAEKRLKMNMEEWFRWKELNPGPPELPSFPGPVELSENDGALIEIRRRLRRIYGP